MLLLMRAEGGLQGTYGLTRKVPGIIAVHIIFATVLAAAMGARDLDVFTTLELQ